ncbi:Sciellin [Triplophysa tibetana]|uniref:Sciellin n=1 Tax=Triplophysa tibetana TaxID=1572043 RepID=A0A5A9PGM7_9TELE|nr:Sciellin [Triplophysa tibetana]
MSFTGKSYSKIQTASSRTVLEDSKKKTSLLKDNSWIKKNVDEDEPVVPGANFGKSVLSVTRSKENITSSTGLTSKTESKSTTVTTPSSVQALTKRFGGSQDKLDETSKTTTTRSTVRTQPKSSTLSMTTTVKDGTKVTETVTTTRKSSSKLETIPAKDFSDIKTKSSGREYKTEVTTVKSSKDTTDWPTSTVRSTTSTKTYTMGDVSPVKTTSYSLKSTKSTEDQLFDTLIPTSIKKTSSTTNSSDYKSEVMNVKSSTNSAVGDYKSEVTTWKSSVNTVDGPTSPVMTTSSIKTYSKEEATSPVKTTTSIKTYTKGDVSPTKSKSYSFQSTKSREDQDISVSKTIRTVYSSNDRPSDYLSDNITSKSSTTVYTSPSITSNSSTTVYTSSERKVSERDLCTFCRKNMYTDEKIILDDMNINCHARCFNCDVCNTSLGHLKAGDSLWVYRSAVHCEGCFNVTKEDLTSTMNLEELTKMQDAMTSFAHAVKQQGETLQQVVAALGRISTPSLSTTFAQWLLVRPQYLPPHHLALEWQPLNHYHPVRL